MTLVSELGGMRLAIQGAISEAFKTPEVIKMFAKKQPAQLRMKYEQLKEDVKLKRLTAAAYSAQAVEILTALKNLGEPLNTEEAAFLQDNMSQQIADFEAASSDIAGAGILSQAAKQVHGQPQTCFAAVDVGRRHLVGVAPNACHQLHDPGHSLGSDHGEDAGFCAEGG